MAEESTNVIEGVNCEFCCEFVTVHGAPIRRMGLVPANRA